MKQVIHSKFKPMKREPLFVALSNQKGGVGKSTFTVLLASYFHYLKGYNVLVVDCDYPQHSISTMRNWEVGNIEKNVHLQNQLVEQFGASGRKAYSILNSTPEEARETAGRFLEKSELDYWFSTFSACSISLHRVYYKRLSIFPDWTGRS